MPSKPTTIANVHGDSQSRIDSERSSASARAGKVRAQDATRAASVTRPPVPRRSPRASRNRVRPWPPRGSSDRPRTRRWQRPAPARRAPPARSRDSDRAARRRGLATLRTAFARREAHGRAPSFLVGDLAFDGGAGERLESVILETREQPHRLPARREPALGLARAAARPAPARRASAPRAATAVGRARR